MDKFVTNPETGRRIKVGGVTYKKLFVGDTRAVGCGKPVVMNSPRGWKQSAPTHGNERHILKQKCGDKCFLQPEKEGFPVCRRCTKDACECEIDCRGVISAKIRAHQYKHTQLYDQIERLDKEHCTPKTSPK